MSRKPRRRRHPPIFIDRCLGQRLPQALRDAGYEVIPHHERFGRSLDDTEWIYECGKRGWIALTKDKAIRRNELERRALTHGRVRAFVVTAGGLTGDRVIDLIGDRIESILDIAEDTEPPFLCRISQAELVVLDAEGNEKSLKPRIKKLSFKRSDGLNGTRERKRKRRTQRHLRS